MIVTYFRRSLAVYGDWDDNLRVALVANMLTNRQS
jgi:hypothetical protein